MAVEPLADAYAINPGPFFFFVTFLKHATIAGYYIGL